MSGEGPSKKICVRRLQMSQPTPDERSNKVNEVLIPYIAPLLQSSDSTCWLPATVWFCGLLSGKDPPRETVLKCRVVPALVLFLTEKDIPELQVEAAKALKYLGSGTSEITKVTIDQVEAAKALSYLAFGTHEVTNITIVQAVNPAHEALRLLLHSKDDGVLRHACCSLAVLSGCKNVKVRELIRDSGLYHRLLELIRHPSLVVAALRTLGNIVEGDAYLIDCIIRDKILDNIQSCLADERVDVRKEACWIISYITAEKGQGRWIQHVCDAGLIEVLVNVVQKDEFVVMEAALRAISNATSGATVEQIGLMVSKGCIEPLCYLFCCRNSEIFKACLEGLEHILEAGNRTEEVNPYVERIIKIQGWTVLEKAGLLYEKELYEKALKLMMSYGAMSPSEYKRRLSSIEDCDNCY